MGIATAITAIVGIASIGLGLKQAAMQKKAMKLQQKQNDNAERRKRRQAHREGLIKRAQIASMGQGAGTLDSSAIAGSSGSVASQVGEIQGYSTQQNALSKQITSANMAAVSAGGMASAISGIGNLFGSLFQPRPQVTTPQL